MRSALLALLGLATAATVVSGAERQLSLGEMTVISDGAGHSRGLLPVDDLFMGAKVVIARAELVLPLSGTATSRTLRLAVFPITRSWSQSAANWTSSWSRPGGDFDKEIVARADVDLRGGQAAARFDVTSHVIRWLEDEEACHGFPLSVPLELGMGVSDEELLRVQTAARAQLRLVYRTVGRPRER